MSLIPFSLSVWEALRRPPIAHPLFRRLTRGQRKVFTPPKPIPLGRRILTSAALMGGLFFGLSFYPHVITPLLCALPLILAFLYMLLFGTVAGAYWTLRISAALTRQREQGLFELLATAPSGRFSVIWAVTTACIYSDDSFSGENAQSVWFMRAFALLVLALVWLVSASNYRTGLPTISLLAVISVIGSTALWFYLDDRQLVVIGALIGMITPQMMRGRVNPLAGALASYSGAQLLTYLLIVGGGLPVISLALAAGLDEDALLVLLPPLLVLIVFALRESLIWGLWRALRGLIDGESVDIRRLSRGGVITL